MGDRGCGIVSGCWKKTGTEQVGYRYVWFMRSRGHKMAWSVKWQMVWWRVGRAASRVPQVGGDDAGPVLAGELPKVPKD